jgi:Tfp pilus assembly protein PilN
MLKVNLIRQRLESAAQKRVWWMVSGVASFLCLVVAGVWIFSAASTLGGLKHEIQRKKDAIATKQGEAEEVRRIKQRAEQLEPLVGLADEVQDTAYRWGGLLYDLNEAVPRRSGVWVEQIQTDFDSSTYEHLCTIQGAGASQDEVSAFERTLTTLNYSFDPTGVTMPSAELQADDQTGTQIIVFTIEATMREPIGVNFQ